MRNEVISGLIAVGLGVVAGLVLFVPFVAISYRRRGGLTFGRFVLWAAALVYFLAIWTYTLLPLPASEDFRCAGVNLDLAAFVGDLRGARSLTDPAVLQLALNVLLFVPLGFFLRVLGGRGLIVALASGLAVSLIIETTQVTGVWGLYPCAYRVFDVDDLLTNTLGALLGSLLALLVPVRLRGRGSVAADAGRLPSPVTRGRRLLAMLCDGLAALMLGYAAAITTQVWLEYVVRDRDAVLAGEIAGTVATLVPLVVWLIVVLATGRSPGDLAVELRYAGGPLPRVLARTLRFVGGAGGYLALTLVPWPAAAPLFAALTIVLTFTPVGVRGLPGILSGQRLVDARERRADADPVASNAAVQRSE